MEVPNVVHGYILLVKFGLPNVKHNSVQLFFRATNNLTFKFRIQAELLTFGTFVV